MPFVTKEKVYKTKRENLDKLINKILNFVMGSMESKNYDCKLSVLSNSRNPDKEYAILGGLQNFLILYTTNYKKVIEHDGFLHNYNKNFFKLSPNIIFLDQKNSSDIDIKIKGNMAVPFYHLTLERIILDYAVDTKFDPIIKRLLMVDYPWQESKKLGHLLLRIEETLSFYNELTNHGITFCSQLKENNKDITVWFKFNNEAGALKKEAQYMLDSWKEPLLMPITLKLFDFIEKDGFQTLLSYDSKTPGLVPEEIMTDYKQFREEVFNDVQKNMQLEIDDKKNIDLFNRVLAHTLMRKYAENSAYQNGQRPLIMPFKDLLKRASKKSGQKDKALDYLRKEEKHYIDAERQFNKLKPCGTKTIVHFDNKEGNVFKTPEGDLRLIGDYSSAMPGYPEYDLARLETGHNHDFVQGYFQLCNTVEDMLELSSSLNSNEMHNMIKRVKLLSYLTTVRTISSEYSRNAPTTKIRKYEALIKSNRNHLQDLLR